MAQIVVEMSGDEAKLWRSMQKVMEGQTKIERNFKKTKDSAKEVEKAIDDQVQGLAEMATAYLGISATVNKILDAEKQREEIANRMKDAAVSLADAQSEAIGNLMLPKAEQDKLIATVEKMASDLRPQGGQATAWRVVSAAASASGGNAKVAEDAARVAMRASPNNVQNMVELAGALPNVNKITGGTSTDALGYILAIGQQAQTRNLADLSRNIVPGAGALTSYGATPEQAGALVAAVQQGMKGRDIEGRLSGTAVVQLAKQLEEMLPEKNTYKEERDASGRVRKTLAHKGTGLKTVIERMDYLAGNQKAREKFLQEASFEAASQVAIEELLGGRGGQTRQRYQENVKQFAPRSQWGKLAEDTIGQLQEPDAQVAADIDRGDQAFQERMLGTIAGKQAVLAGLFSRAKLDTALGNAGVGYLERTAQSWEYRTSAWQGMDPEKNFAQQMTKAAAIERSSGGAEGRARSDAILTFRDEQLEEAKKLRKQIEGLREDLNRRSSTPSPAAVDGASRQHAPNY
jgi:hypothetical protein